MSATSQRTRGLELVRRELDNGAVVIVSPEPLLGFVAIGLWHDVGSMHDPPGRSGLAHLAEHVIFGTRARGRSNAATSFDRTSFIETGPPESVGTILADAAERLGHARSTHTEDEVARHRAVVVEEIRQREQPARFGSGLRRSLALRFAAAHPFGRPPLGVPAELAEISANEVDDFVRSRYAAPGLVISIVGSVDPQRVIGLVERHFSSLPGMASPPEAGVVSSPRGTAYEDVFEDQPQGLVRCTFALPADAHTRTASAEVAFAAAAGSAWSLLGSSLVGSGTALATSSGRLRCGAGPSIGTVKVGAAEGTDMTGLTQRVLDELQTLARDPLDRHLFEAALARVIKERMARLTTARLRAEDLGAQEAWHHDASTINDRVAEVEAVTPDDVRETSARWIHDPAVVVFHPRSEVGDSWIP